MALLMQATTTVVERPVVAPSSLRVVVVAMVAVVAVAVAVAVVERITALQEFTGEILPFLSPSHHTCLLRTMSL